MTNGGRYRFETHQTEPNMSTATSEEEEELS